MLNYNTQPDDCIVELERMVDHQMTMITSLCSRLGTLEDALRRVQEEPSRPSTPEVIDLTLDEEEDDYVTSSSVIDLSDTDIVDLLGGPIEVQVEREDTRVPETPPPQEVMEALRSTLIREEDNREANRAADLLVRAGLALPEYEEAPEYTEFE